MLMQVSINGNLIVGYDDAIELHHHHPNVPQHPGYTTVLYRSIAVGYIQSNGGNVV